MAAKERPYQEVLLSPQAFTREFKKRLRVEPLPPPIHIDAAPYQGKVASLRGCTVVERNVPSISPALYEATEETSTPVVIGPGTTLRTKLFLDDSDTPVQDAGEDPYKVPKQGYPRRGAEENGDEGPYWVARWQEVALGAADTRKAEEERRVALEDLLAEFADVAVPMAMALIRSNTAAGVGTPLTKVDDSPLLDSKGGARVSFIGTFTDSPQLSPKNSATKKNGSRTKSMRSLSLAKIVENIRLPGYRGALRKMSNLHRRGEEAPSKIVVVNGISFIFALTRDTVKLYQTAEGCMKALMHRFRGMNAIHTAGVKGVAPFPYLVVTYLGHRVLAMPELPAEGTEDFRPFADQHLTMQVARRLNLRGHWTGEGDLRRYVYLSGDLQAYHSGRDNRVYFTGDGAGRLFPPEPPNPLFPQGYLYRHLRPEVVKASRRETSSRSNEPMPLSSDAYSPFGTSRANEHNLDVTLVSDVVVTGQCPKLVDSLLLTVWEERGGGNSKVDTDAIFLAPYASPGPRSRTLSDIFHSFGVNMRCLGMVVHILLDRLHRVKAAGLMPFEYSPDTAISVPATWFAGPIGSLVSTLRTEMTSRTMKDIIHADMRYGGNGLRELLNHLFGDEYECTDEDIENRVAFWFDVVVPRLERKFGVGRSHTVHPFSLEDINRSHLFQRIQHLTGIRLQRGDVPVASYADSKRRFAVGLEFVEPVPIVDAPPLPAVQFSRGERRFYLHQALTLIRKLNNAHPAGKGTGEETALGDEVAQYITSELGSTYFDQDIDVVRYLHKRQLEKNTRVRKARENIHLLTLNTREAITRACTVSFPIARNMEYCSFDISDEALGPWGVVSGQRVRTRRTGKEEVEESTIVGVRGSWLWRVKDGQMGATAFHAASASQWRTRYSVEVLDEVVHLPTVSPSWDSAPVLPPPSSPRKSPEIRPISPNTAASQDCVEVPFNYITPAGYVGTFDIGNRACSRFGPDLQHGDLLLLGAGELEGHLVTVLGVLCGEVYVLHGASRLPRVLRGPPGSLNSRYGVTKVGSASISPFPDKLAVTVQAEYYSITVRSCIQYGFYHGQRLVLCKGPHRGAISVVLGVRADSLWLMLEEQRRPIALEGCRNGQDVLGQHAPIVVGMSNVVEDGMEDELWYDPPENLTLHSFKYRTWTGEVVAFDARTSVTLKFGGCLGRILRIVKGRWLHRKAVAIGVRTSPSGTPCLWGLVKGYPGAVPLDESAYVSTGLPLIGMHQVTDAGEDEEWVGAVPVRPLEYLTCLGSVEAFETDPATCVKYGVVSGQRLLLATDQSTPSELAVVVGVWREEVWVTEEGRHYAIPITGRHARELATLNYVQPIGMTRLQPFADVLQVPGSRVFQNNDHIKPHRDVLSYVTSTMELVGFDISERAFHHYGRGFHSGMRLKQVEGHRCQMKRQKDPTGGVHMEYDWEEAGTTCTVIGIHLEMLWIHVGNEPGAIPIDPARARCMAVIGTARVTPVTEKERVARLQRMRDEAAARKLAEDQRLIIYEAECFPPPSVVPLDPNKLAMCAELVAQERVRVVREWFQSFRPNLRRRAVEHILATHGVVLPMQHTESEGYRLLAAAWELGAEGLFPSETQYLEFCEKNQHTETLPTIKGTPSFAELYGRRLQVLKARRMVRLDELVVERANRIIHEEQERGERLKQALQDHLSPKQMLKLQNPRRSVRTTFENLTGMVQRLKGLTERDTMWTIGWNKDRPSSTAPPLDTDQESGNTFRPEPLLQPMPLDEDLLLYVTERGEGIAFDISVAATARWDMRAATRVRYTKGDLEGMTAVILGVHDNALWRYDEDSFGSPATPFAAQNAEELQKVHGIEVVQSEEVVVRTHDPFTYLRCDGRAGLFDISPSGCESFGVYHGQRYACGKVPPALHDAEMQIHGRIMPPLRETKKAHCLERVHRKLPYVITVIGVHEYKLWYAVNDLSGAIPYTGDDIVRDFDLSLLYTVATIQPGPATTGTFQYLGRLRSNTTSEIKSLKEVFRRGVTEAMTGSTPPSPRLRVRGRWVDNPLKTTLGVSHTDKGTEENRWSGMVFDITPSRIAAFHPSFRHGTRVRFPGRPTSYRYEHDQFGTVIGVARLALWVHMDADQGAKPLTHEAMSRAVAIGAVHIPQLLSGGVTQERRPFRYLTASGSVGLFDVSKDMLTRFGVNHRERIVFSMGSHEKAGIVVGVRRGLLWFCPADGEGASPFLGARNKADLNKFAIKVVGTAPPLTQFVG